MAMSTFFHRLMKSFVLVFLLHFTIPGFSQPTTREERTVTGKVVFICSYGSHAPGTDTFATAVAGCKHWLTHLPAGYVYQKVDGINEIGSVKCICKKGNEVNDQAGMIRGIIVCPDELATPIDDGTPFPNKKCECPDKLSAPYYKAKGNRCVLDCAEKLDGEGRMQEQGLTNAYQGTPQEREAATKRIAEYKKENQSSEKRNFGYLEGEINGNPVSNEIVSSGGTLDPGVNEIFEAHPAKGGILGEGTRLKDKDTEYKMMNKLATDLGAEKGQTYCDTKGTLTIVSERKYCGSCQNVIMDFNDMYPNVKLILIDGVK
jgi:hypothetical protein